MGQGVAVTAAKTAAGAFGIALHLTSVHRVVAPADSAVCRRCSRTVDWRSCSTGTETISARRGVAGVLIRQQLERNDLEDGGGRHRENRADDAQQLPPISSATITVTALTPTCRDMIFGTSMWFSSCCCRKKKISTRSDLLRRHRRGHRDRGNRRGDRADHRNQLADAPQSAPARRRTECRAPTGRWPTSPR